jgi:hypothetical protein
MTGTRHESHRTKDHQEIRRWVESRGGKPAAVKGTGGDEDPGILRVDFPGYGDESSLEAISWDEFFQKFDESRLDFLYQDRTKGGELSRFFKFVRSDQVH